METRKLIKFGGSSHIISIPNSWIKKNSLNKGDIIKIKENGNGELVLYSEIKEDRPTEKKKVIDGSKNISDIKREIISGYINNYNVIEINGGNIVRFNKKINKIINNLVAIEIIEESSNKIVARDFLNMKEVSVENLIRRIDTIIRLMIERSELEDKELAYEEIKNLDNGINKLRFLLYKIVRSGMKDLNIARKLNLSNEELLKTWLMVSYLEEIADELRRYIRFRKGVKIFKRDRENLNVCFNSMKKSYAKVMEAYYKKDLDKAHEIASQKDIHLMRCDEFLRKTKNKDLGPVVEKIKSVESWIRNISWGIING